MRAELRPTWAGWDAALVGALAAEIPAMAEIRVDGIC